MGEQKSPICSTKPKHLSLPLSVVLSSSSKKPSPAHIDCNPSFIYKGSRGFLKTYQGVFHQNKGLLLEVSAHKLPQTMSARELGLSLLRGEPLKTGRQGGPFGGTKDQCGIEKPVHNPLIVQIFLKPLWYFAPKSAPMWLCSPWWDLLFHCF